MTGPYTTHDDEPGEPITPTVEIDLAQFDEPRKMMYERLVEEYGHETIAELVVANVSQDSTTQGIHLHKALWDNRDQIRVDPAGVGTTQVPGLPGVGDD